MANEINRYSQSFDAGSAGFAPFGTGSISVDGGVATLQGSMFTNFGGYSSEFAGGYTTRVKVYLDSNWAENDGLSYSVASNNLAGSHLRDFAFHVMHIVDEGVDKFVIGVSNGAGYDVPADLAGYANAEVIEGDGWYTFEHVFRDNGTGQLEVVMNVYNDAGTLVYDEILGGIDNFAGLPGVGGNRYGWFKATPEAGLQIDDAELFLAQGVGLPGSETLVGSENGTDEIFYASAGDDTIDGGSGVDTYDASANTTGILVDLGTANDDGGPGDEGFAFGGSQTGYDTLINIENVVGGSGNDNLRGNGEDNTFFASGGADQVNGRGGSDTFDASAVDGPAVINLTTGAASYAGGSATLTSIENVVGTDDDDIITGSSADNSLAGGDGNDTFNASAGTDTIDGGSGNDRVVFSGAYDDYTVTWSNGQASVSGADGTTTIVDAGMLQFDDIYVLLVGQNGGDYETLQSAVDVAEQLLDKPKLVLVDEGTYTEQVVIEDAADIAFKAVSSDVTIKAVADLVETAISTGGRETHAVVTVLNSTNITFEGFAVDGDGRGNTISEGAGAQAANNVGIYYQNASGGLTNVDIFGVRDATFNGNQRGTSLQVDNSSLLDFFVTGGEISDFQKAAVVIGKANLTMSGLTVIGNGATGVTAQNGLQIMNSTGTVTGVTVSDIGYVGSGWASSLFILQNNTDLNVYQNILSGAEDAIVYGIVVAGGAGGAVHQNQISDVQIGVYAYGALNPSVGIYDNAVSELGDESYASGIYFYPNAVGDSHDVSGTAETDYLFGGNNSDTLAGLGGDDYIDGGAGDDSLFGGDGEDTLVGGAGGDYMEGGEGDDVFVINSAAEIAGDTIIGGDGTDTIFFAPTSDEVLEIPSNATGIEKVTLGGSADAGVDATYAANGLTITGNAGTNAIIGSDYDDTIETGGGADTVDGGHGVDTVIYDNAVTIEWNGSAWTADGDVLTGVERVEANGTVYWLVSPDSEFDTIQSAIDAAEAGETVLVAAGSYTEDLVFSQGVNVIASGLVAVEATNAAISFDNFQSGTGGVSIDGIDFSGGTYGVYAPAGSGVDSLDIICGSFTDHSLAAIWVEDTSIASLSVTGGTYFSGNALNAASFAAVIKLYGFTGSASFDGILIAGGVTGTAPGNAIEITGTINTELGDGTADMGSVTIGDVVVIGAFDKSPVAIYNFDNVDGLTITGLDVSGAEPGPTATPGVLWPVVNLDGILGDINAEGFVITTVDGQLVALQGEKTGSGQSVDDSVITGTDNDDIIVGKEGTNILDGGLGDDQFVADLGADTIVGGEGYDAVNYLVTALESADFESNGTVWSVAGDTLEGVEVVNTAEGRFLLVGNGGYATIQDAVNAAEDGDVILVAGGPDGSPVTYTGNVTINQPNISIVGVGDVVIEGTFSDTQNTAVTGDLNVWLQSHGYNTSAGNAFTVGASNVSISNLTINDYAVGVKYDGASGPIVGGSITDVNVTNSLTAIDKLATLEIQGLVVDGLHVTDGMYGLVLATGNTTGSMIDLIVKNSSFTDLMWKGIYAEALMGSTLFTDLHMDNVGLFGGGPNSGNLHKHGAGIDINLKYFDYDGSTITIDVFEFNSVGNSLDPANSGAILIKGRDDAPSYDETDAAQVDGLTVIIKNGVIDDTAVGIKAGEAGKLVTGPEVIVEDVLVTNAEFGQVENITKSVMTVNSADGQDYEAVPGSTGDIVFNGDDGDNSFTGGNGDDVFHGGDGMDILSGGGGDDLFDGGAGNDTIFGGAGEDTVSYAGSVQITSTAGGWEVFDGTDTDTVNEVEIVQAGSQRTLLVGHDGYGSIQAAIDDAEVGDIIMVAAGSYTENLNINKAVTILGAQHGANATGRDGSSGTGETTIIGQHTIATSADVTINGFRFLNDATTTNSVLAGPTIAFTNGGGLVTISNNLFYSTVAGGANGVADRAISVSPIAGGKLVLTDNSFSGSKAEMYAGASWGTAVWFDSHGIDLEATGNLFNYARTAMNIDVYTGTDAVINVSGNTFDSVGSGISGGVNYVDAETTIADNDFKDVGTDFNFRNLNDDVVFDAEVAIDQLTPSNPVNDPVVVLGGGGDDTLYGTSGSDVLTGNGLNAAADDADQLFGRGGDDLLSGNGGDDYLDGGEGNDVLNGGDGNDQLVGGLGDDELNGGAGIDTAVYTGDVTVTLGVDGWEVSSATEGNDTIDGVEIVSGSNGRFLMVGAGGFATLADALAVAQEYDTIMLAAEEIGSGFHIITTANLTILGAKAGVPVAGRDLVGGVGESTYTGGLAIAAAGVMIDGVRFTGAASAPGWVDLAAVHVGGTGAEISNSLFYYSGTVDSDGSRGIITQQGATGLTVTGNAFTGWHTGTYVNGTGNTTVSNNVFEGNLVGMSLDAYAGSSGLSVTGNSFINQVLEGMGIGVGSPGSSWTGTISNNTFNGMGLFNYDTALSTSVVTGNTFNGSSGDDPLMTDDSANSGRIHNNTINGGAGQDTVTYATATAAITANLATGTASGASIGVDTLISIENITTGSGNDTITGSAVDNVIVAGGGDDVIKVNLGGGNDSVDGGLGNDRLEISASASGANYVISGTNKSNSVQAGANTLTTENLETIKVTSTGNVVDVLDLSGMTGATLADMTKLDVYLGGGNDTYVVGKGSHTVRGEAGIDTVDLRGTTSGANIDLQTGFLFKGTDGADSVTGFENVIGSDAGNTVKGTGANNTLVASLGFDDFDGRGGEDTFDASAMTVGLSGQLGFAIYSDDFSVYTTLTSVENLITGSGDDNVAGDDFNNVIITGAGNDFIFGGGGNDTIHGGDGIDTMRFSGNRSDYKILFTGEGTGTITDLRVVGNEGVDTFTGIERWEFADVTIEKQPAAVLDFNGDGTADILRKNAGGWYSYVGADQPDQISLGLHQKRELLGTFDVNGDGQDDLLFMNPNGTSLSYYETYVTPVGQVGGVLKELGTFGGSRTFVGAGDFDADGIADFLFYSASTGYSYAEGGSLGSQTIIGHNDGRNLLAVADLDGDGAKDDLIFRHSSGYYSYLEGGDANNRVDIGWNNGRTLIGVADIDGDGKDDLLFRAPNDWYSYLSGGVESSYVGLGRAVTDPNTPTQETLVRVGLGDLDGDGTMDLIFSNGAGDLFHLAGGSLIDIGNLAGRTVEAFDDFDGDGRADILLSNGAGDLMLASGGDVDNATLVGNFANYEVITDHVGVFTNQAGEVLNNGLFVDDTLIA